MANGVSPSSQAAPTPATWGVAQRLGGIFVSPTETFRAIVRDPDILPPLVILIGISVVTWELILSRIGIAQVLRSQLEMSGRASSMTPDQVQKYVSTASKYAPIIGRFAALVSVPFFILVVALIGLALMKAIFGLQFQFKTAYSVTTYAWLPWILSGILAIAVVLFGDPSAFNVAAPAPTNLGFFLSPESVAPSLYTAAGSLDIFSFWTMALLGIGFSEAVGKKVRARTVFLCFFGLWALLVLLRMGLSAI